MSDAKPLIEEARRFAHAFASVKHPLLLGITDGKAVGTYIETAFKVALTEARVIRPGEGNAARGIDLPSLNTDIKVTSERQPQSSSPFGSFNRRSKGWGMTCSSSFTPSSTK